MGAGTSASPSRPVMASSVRWVEESPANERKARAMSRELLQRYFEELCETSRQLMSSEERSELQRERIAIATELAFWNERNVR
jgi:hypothetical protein